MGGFGSRGGTGDVPMKDERLRGLLREVAMFLTGTEFTHTMREYNKRLEFDKHQDEYLIRGDTEHAPGCVACGAKELVDHIEKTIKDDF